MLPPSVQELVGPCWLRVPLSCSQQGLLSTQGSPGRGSASKTVTRLMDKGAQDLSSYWPESPSPCPMGLSPERLPTQPLPHQSEKGQDGSHNFYNVISVMTSHRFHHSLFVSREALGPAHTPREGLHAGVNPRIGGSCLPPGGWAPKVLLGWDNL